MRKGTKRQNRFALWGEKEGGRRAATLMGYREPEKERTKRQNRFALWGGRREEEGRKEGGRKEGCNSVGA